ncbi:MAG: lysostaphin resistance A-like protein [Gammaproteobacteria bacterium]
MPTLAEETVFRGVFFVILEKAFGESDVPRKWWQSRAVWITALAFGLVHGWYVSNGVFLFAVFPCVNAFVIGVILGALRKSTGSLAFPMALHSALNLSAALFP